MEDNAVLESYQEQEAVTSFRPETGRRERGQQNLERSLGPFDSSPSLCRWTHSFYQDLVFVEQSFSIFLMP